MLDAARAKPTLRLFLCGLALLSTSLLNLQVHARPSQKPLLVGQAGAKPNLMITLDNSGSMAFSYHESYGVVANTNSEIELLRCKDDEYSLLTGVEVWGGTADFANGNRCWKAGRATTATTPHNPPRKVAGSRSAQRSADVNPLYYNPRTTYLPRVNASGTPLSAGDGFVWVSNQTSTLVEYIVYKNSEGKIFVRNSMFADTPVLAPVGYKRVYGFSVGLSIPQVLAHKTTDINTPGFTYAYCSKVTTWDGLQMGCAEGAWTDVTIQHGSAAPVRLPAGHHRTECEQASQNICSHKEEVANIMNWYRYYAFRAPAVATAIGQALANTKAYGNLRLGYTRFFDTDGDGRANNASVVFVGEGGFSRGIAVQNGPGTAAKTSTQRKRRASDGNSGEANASGQICQGGSNGLSGTGSKRINGFTTCPGWSRTQYQLSSPPSN